MDATPEARIRHHQIEDGEQNRTALHPAVRTLLRVVDREPRAFFRALAG